MLKHPILIVVYVTLAIAGIFVLVHIYGGAYSKKRVIEDCRILIEAEFKKNHIPITPENSDPTNPDNEENVRNFCEEWRLNTIRD